MSTTLNFNEEASGSVDSRGPMAALESDDKRVYLPFQNYTDLMKKGETSIDGTLVRRENISEEDHKEIAGYFESFGLQ